MKAFFCLLLSLSLLLGGCSKGEVAETQAAASESPRGMRSTVLYYATDEGFLVPVMKPIPWEEGIGKAALTELMAQGEAAEELALRGLVPTVPAGTKLSLRIDEEKHATVDLSGLGPLENAGAEARMLASISATLREFPSIETVSFTLGGKKAESLPHGTALSVYGDGTLLNVEEKSFLAVGARPGAESGGESLSLYFPNATASLYVPVSRYSPQKADLSAVCQALLSGPEDGRLLACFPEGTALEFAEVYEDTACVGLTGALWEEASPELQRAALKSLYLSVRALPGIEKLEVYADGELFLPEETALETPLYANLY